MRTFLLSILVLAAVFFNAARADLLLYPLPGLPVAFVVEGKVTVNPGRTVTLQHPRFGNLYFDLQTIRYYKVPTTESLANRKVQAAIGAQDADRCIEAARWALHHGHLDKFYLAASAAWRANPNHPAVERLVAMKRLIDAPVPVSIAQEEELRKYVKVGGSMKIARSRHFLMLHDTSPEKDPFSRKTRAVERLELLETVYESFLLKFSLEGYNLQVPKEHLKVVLFADRQDFLTTGEKHLEMVAGYYDMKANTSVFYDQSTNEEHKVLERVNGILQQEKERAIKMRSPGAKDLVRFANTLQLLLRVSRENADIEVVSHEATHHMAAATGLLPNDSPVPHWAHEGLATYFESPKDAAWSGIGAVNDGRLKDYRLLAGDQEHSNVRFIASNQIFSLAASGGALNQGYAQAWALTHFLMDRHFDKLIEYYQLVAKEKSEEPLEADHYERLFTTVFGEDLDVLEAQWRKYMASLKTDLEVVIGER